MKKDIVNQKRLSEELGIDFNEAVELFSEETLNSMKMESIVGGTPSVNNGGLCIVVNDAKKCKINNCSCKQV